MNQRNTAADVIARARALLAATERLIQRSAKVMEEMEELEQKTTNRIVDQRLGEKLSRTRNSDESDGERKGVTGDPTRPPRPALRAKIDSEP